LAVSDRKQKNGRRFAGQMAAKSLRRLPAADFMTELNSGRRQKKTLCEQMVRVSRWAAERQETPFFERDRAKAAVLRRGKLRI